MFSATQPDHSAQLCANDQHRVLRAFPRVHCRSTGEIAAPFSGRFRPDVKMKRRETPMHSETRERVERIRAKALAGKASVSDLNAQITDAYVKQLLKLASNWFDDVEVFWIGTLQRDRMPPRSLAEESRWLDQAEFFLESIARPQLKAVQDMVAKFGPNLQSIG